jgi:hypothetical protein
MAIRSYDPDQAAREAADPVPFTNPSTSTSNVGGNVSINAIEERRGANGVSFKDRWRFDPLGDGTISSTDSLNSNIVMETTAILGDYGNRNTPWQNGTVIHSLSSAVAEWANRNVGKDIVGNARAMLIAKGWLTGDAAKITGNFVDEALINALNGAAAQISYRNYNRLLTNLSDAPSTENSFGGVNTTITRQEFKQEDYRIAVDKAYRDITGQAASDTTLDTYLEVLRKLESDNPNKRVSKTTGSASNSTTTLTETGGVSAEAAQDVLLKQAIAEPETEYYQKATTFMDYFNEAIKAKVDL